MTHPLVCETIPFTVYSPLPLSFLPTAFSPHPICIIRYTFQGLRNTHLMRTYTEVDERFHKLGYALKHWATICSINDASLGLLSSYALLNMLIHYLQRTEPPVLPYLQQVRHACVHVFPCAYMYVCYV